jgi:hypothetical protein
MSESKLVEYTAFKDCPPIDGLLLKDISHEEWREYEHGGQVFRIDSPVALYYREGGTTHRVVDHLGVSHCHPIPGNGCALRWFNGFRKPPVHF